MKKTLLREKNRELLTWQFLESCHKHSWMGRGRCLGASCTARSAAPQAGCAACSSALAPPGASADGPSETGHSHTAELSATGRTGDVIWDLIPHQSNYLVF